MRWIVALLLLAACSSRAGTSQHAFEVFEEEGVPVAVSSRGPRYIGELFSYEGVMVLDTYQHEDTVLYRPEQFMADEDGNMYINDTGIGSILAFDPAGRYSHSIGAQGFGPGEASWWLIQLIRDGVIQAYGIKERRTTRFQTDGTLLDVTTLPSEIDLLGNVQFILLPDDRRLILTNESPTPERRVGKGGNLTEYQRWGAVIFSADWDTIGAAHTTWMRVARMVDVKKGGAMYAAPIPIAFGPLPTVLYHPIHGIVLSLSEQPELQLYDMAGQMTRRIRIEMPSETVTEADREIARQALLQSVPQEDEAARITMASMVELYAFADAKAFWGMVEIDSEGYFWLDLSLHPEETSGDFHTFMVLSPEGEYLGMTTRPYGPNAHIARGRMYILEQDAETGEIVPAIYGIRPAVRGFAYPK